MFDQRHRKNRTFILASDCALIGHVKWLCFFLKNISSLTHTRYAHACNYLRDQMWPLTYVRHGSNQTQRDEIFSSQIQPRHLHMLLCPFSLWDIYTLGHWLKLDRERTFEKTSRSKHARLYSRATKKFKFSSEKKNDKEIGERKKEIIFTRLLQSWDMRHLRHALCIYVTRVRDGQWHNIHFSLRPSSIYAWFLTWWYTSHRWLMSHAWYIRPTLQS